MTAVDFDGVSRRFGDTRALDDVSVAIEAGETVALLGPNGAGKTTAIGIMLGLLEPSSGRAATLGMAPHDAVRSGRVGAMLQSAGLPPGARVGELVDLARALYPAPSPRDAILERAGLAALVNRRAETLSGGEAQRVRFAFAIAGDPDLVFLDEPTVAMDVEARRAFWEDMRRFAAEGRTVLFATHYLDEADHIADRIVVLDHGRIVGDGSPAELKATVTERVVRFALPTADAAGDAVLAGLPGRAPRRAARRLAVAAHRRRRCDRPGARRGRRRLPPPRGGRRRPRRRVPRADVGRSPRRGLAGGRVTHVGPPQTPRTQETQMLATRRAATSALPALPPFLAYLRLEVRRSLRNRRYLVFTVVFPVMLYVLYTAVLPDDGVRPDRRPALERRTSSCRWRPTARWARR